MNDWEANWIISQPVNGLKEALYLSIPYMYVLVSECQYMCLFVCVCMYAIYGWIYKSKTLANQRA